MRNSVIGLLLGFTLLNAPLRAEFSVASMSPDEVRIALTAIRTPRRLPKLAEALC